MLKDLDNDAIVINNSGGLIQVDYTVSWGISNSNAATTASITNDGEIIIGSQGVVGSIGAEGIYNINALTNNTNGLIQIDNTASHGLFLLFASASVTNDGDIKIGSSGAGSIGNQGLSINGTGISNNANGLIQVDNTTDYGIINGSTLTNDGEIKIGNIGAIGSDGIWNRNSATFHNSTCASVFLHDNLNNTSTAPITNDGFIYVNTPETHTTGLFVNNGVIEDPQKWIRCRSNRVYQ